MEHDLLERVIVSPIAGVFTPLVHASSVAAGAAVGVVRAGIDEVTIVSPFAGELVDLCATAGERVQAFQRIAWLRVA